MEILRRTPSVSCYAGVSRRGVGRSSRALHIRRFAPDLYKDEEPMPMEQIREIAEREPTPLSLQQMRSFAGGDKKLRLMSATFLHKELQARFARAIVELSDLPMGLNETTSVRQAIAVYRHELLCINSVKPPTTSNEDRLFTESLRKAKARGSNLVPLICYGLHEVKRTDLGGSALQFESVQEDITTRLDKFFLNRIGIRMLIGHHVESLERQGGRVHLVDAEEVVRVACERARKLCVEYCGVAPPVEIRATDSVSTPFMYVQSHLHHMVFELVKNAMRATVENHQKRTNKADGKVNRFERVMNPESRSLDFYIPSVDDVNGVTVFPDVRKYSAGEELPPVKLVLCLGSEDLTVKVSDQGGGVPRSRWQKLWHYDYTTSPPCPPIESNNYHSFRQHFSGGGYGLPIARLFARYFGGEVTFTSLEGSGSTAFIQAHRLGSNLEVIPGHATFSLQPLYS